MVNGLEKEKKLRRQIDETENFTDFKALMYDQYGLTDGSILFFDEAQESKTLENYVKSFKAVPSVSILETLNQILR